jgi:hypothetical protein
VLREVQQGFAVLLLVRLNNTFLNMRFWRQILRWDMTQCSLDNVTYKKNLQYLHLEHGTDNKAVIQNPGAHLPNYIVPHPSRQ